MTYFSLIVLDICSVYYKSTRIVFNDAIKANILMYITSTKCDNPSVDVSVPKITLPCNTPVCWRSCMLRLTLRIYVQFLSVRWPVTREGRRGQKRQMIP